MNGLNFYPQIGVFFMFVCSCVAGIIGYINRRKHSYLKGIYLYPLASLVHTILFYISAHFHVIWKIKRVMLYLSEDIFLFIEFFIIYYFFLKTLKIQSVRKLLFLIEVVYILIVFCFWLTFKSFFKLALSLYTLQAFFILVPVTTYYFELIKWPPHDKLSQIPSFWVATGITVYFACTTPLFLLKDFVFSGEYLKEQNLYLINFIAYGVMFLFIAKAYSCPKKGTPIIKHS